MSPMPPRPIRFGSRYRGGRMSVSTCMQTAGHRPDRPYDCRSQQGRNGKQNAYGLSLASGAARRPLAPMLTRTLAGTLSVVLALVGGAAVSRAGSTDDAARQVSSGPTFVIHGR